MDIAVRHREAARKATVRIESPVGAANDLKLRDRRQPLSLGPAVSSPRPAHFWEAARDRRA